MTLITQYLCDSCDEVLEMHPYWDKENGRPKLHIKFSCTMHFNNSLVSDKALHFCSEQCLKAWTSKL